jgi:L-ribulose-5-phosphate 3-epimerase
MKAAMSLVLNGTEQEIDRTLGMIADAGFDGVEPTWIPEDGLPRVDHFEKDAQRLRAMADRRGLEIHSCRGGPLLWRFGQTAPELERRERGREIIRGELRAGRIMGSTGLLCVPGLIDETQDYLQAHDHAAQGFRMLGDDAEAAGIPIGVENVESRFLTSPFEACRFLDAVDHPRIGFYFDVGNVLNLWQAYPNQWIDALGKRIVKIHLKDYSNASRTIVHLLTGEVNWPLVMRSIAAIGYDDYLSAEVPLYTHAPEKMLRDTRDAIDVLAGMA